MPNIDSLITAAAAAKQTGKPKRTILHAIKVGKLPAQKVPGYNGVYLISQADLDAWVARCEKAGA